MWLCLLPTIPPTFLPQKLCRKCSLHICTGFSPYVTLPLNSRMEVILAAPLTECTGLSWWEYSWEEKPSEGSEGAQFLGSSRGGLHPRFQKPLQRGWLSCEGQSPMANYGHWVAYDSRASEMGLVQYLFWFLSGNESTSLHLLGPEPSACTRMMCWKCCLSTPHSCDSQRLVLIAFLELYRDERGLKLCSTGIGSPEPSYLPSISGHRLFYIWVSLASFISLVCLSQSPLMVPLWAVGWRAPFATPADLCTFLPAPASWCYCVVEWCNAQMSLVFSLCHFCHQPLISCKINIFPDADSTLSLSTW